MTPEELAASEAQAAAEAEAAKTLADEETKEAETKEDKRPSSVAKLLAQRNEAREKAKTNEEKAAKVEDLTKKNAELEELVAKQALDTEAKAEKNEFFEKNSYAKEFEADIDALRADKKLSYEDAAKLVIAEKKPELLLEDAVRNKMSGWAPLTGVAKDNAFDGKNPESTEDFSKMSADEFLEWGNKMARAERAWSWLIR